jgi:choline transport protein
VGIYQQATGSAGGAFGLTFIIFLPMCCCLIGCFITNGRTLWTLARDDATPCSGYLGKISPRWKNPFNATVLCGVLTSLLGIIYVGSTTAFNAIVGSFVLLSTISYLGAILPHLLSGRKNVTPGPFWMGKIGFFINGVSVLYIMASVVIFSFPFVKPVSAQNMNYVCVIVGGLTIFTTVWWLIHGRKTYVGPVGHIPCPKIR